MKDEQLISQALERFKQAQEFESENRERAEEDLRFISLEQWPEELKRARETDPRGSRPCLVMDKVNQYIRQVVNDQRQNKPQPKIRPVDDYSDEEVADIIEGVIRNILDKSSADIAIDTAFESAVNIGFGYFRVTTDYSDDMSFDQDIEIKRVRNPFTVYLDPFSQEPDGSDAKWGFVVEELTKEEFEQQYPKAEAVDWDSKEYNDWISKDSIRIAEYFHIEPESIDIVQLSNGAVIPAKELENIIDMVPANIRVVNERKTTVNRVKWCKLTANQVLETTDWAGKYIPIIPVYGNETVVDGKVKRFGLVHSSKDAQRAYNYAVSSFIERVALVPKAPYIAAAGQIEDYEQEWSEANVANIPVLHYNPITVGGSVAPPPQRQQATDVPQGWLGVMQSAEHDIQASIGMYQASLGAEGNEKSGIAILNRQREGDVSTYHYQDNLSRSIRHLGRILVDLMPKIYDTKRVLRIIGEDEEVKNVTFDPRQPQAVTPQQNHEGKEVNRIYNPTIGKYDVTVTTGASYSTKRQEAASAMLEITRAYPELMGVAGDIMVRNMDWPGAEELAERIKKTLPPGLVEGEEEEQQLPPQVQQALMQASQSIQDLTAQLAMKEQELDDKNKAIQIDAEKVRIDAYNAETNRIKATSESMTPEQINQLIQSQIAALISTPDISKGDNPVLDYSTLA